MLAPLLLLALPIKLPWTSLRELIQAIPAYLGAVSEVNVWGVPSLPMGWKSLNYLLEGLVVVVPLFGLLSLIFIPIGQLVGYWLECAPNGILGYTVNVLASLAGILLYTVLCFYNQPPAVWFAAAGALALLLLREAARLRWTCMATLAVCIALVILPTGDEAVVQWSPYQKLTLKPIREAGQIIAYSLTTNDSWFQQILNLSPEFVSSHPDMFKDTPIEWNAYNIPYHFYPNPPAALILGAGMGNDVAAALRNGAGQVVAVEIDPLIIKDGRRLHFEKPYSSPRVRQVVDDARSYIQNSSDKFDLIVFSLLDSHTTSSHYSNIRIDNYVYTVEALDAAKRLLRPDGVFIVKFQANTPWIAGRLDGLVSRAFGHPPLQLQADEFTPTTPATMVGGKFVYGRFFHLRIGADHRPRACRCEAGRIRGCPWRRGDGEGHADHRRLALLLSARTGLAGQRAGYFGRSGSALLGADAADGDRGRLDPLALFLSGRGLPAPGGADHQQVRAAFWNHLDGQRSGDLRRAGADRGGELPGRVEARGQPPTGLRRNFCFDGDFLRGSAPGFSFPLCLAEGHRGHRRTWSAGVFRGDRFHSEFRPLRLKQ
jgi:SAM-dependent methyltransferase